jgi:hypothetical protein
MVAKITVKPTRNSLVYFRGVRDRVVGRISAKGDKAGKILVDSVRRHIRGFAKERTGALEKSFGYTLRVTKGGYVNIHVWSDSPYAIIHEDGGEIRPRKARALAIPLTPEAKAAGSPRNFPGKLFRPNKRGKGKVKSNVLVVKGGPRGGAGGVTKHYALVTRVRLRPRHYITKAAEKAAPKLKELFTQEVIRVHNEAAAGARR